MKRGKAMNHEENKRELRYGEKHGSEPRRDDLLWKDLLARFFVPMLHSLLPDLARDIDGKREVIFLDKELHRLTRIVFIDCFKLGLRLQNNRSRYFTASDFHHKD